MQACKIFTFFLLIFSCKAAYEDSRCKCVCVDHSVPNTKNSSSGDPTRTVYVKSVPADKCTCPMMLEAKASLCPYCECKYQVRNTSTIKVVVCLIVVIIAALSIYLIFMLLLEPLLSSRARRVTPGIGTTTAPSQKKKPDQSRGDRNGMGTPDVSSTHKQQEFNVDGVRNRDDSGLGSVSAVVNRAREHQDRWQGSIQLQRDLVFTEHSVLN